MRLICECIASCGFSCLLHVLLSSTEGSSLPRQCTSKFCEEGTICAVNRRGIPKCNAISSKPGVCPNDVTNPACLTLRGAPGCLFDTDCPGTTKCCRACCQEATTQSQLDQVRFSVDLKPGICPDQLEYVDVWWWTDLFCPDKGFINDCEKDPQCPGADKCCPGLCGKECTRIKFDLPRIDDGTSSTISPTTEAVTQSTIAPTTETVTQSTISPTTEAVTQSTTENTTESTTQQSTTLATESSTKSTTAKSAAERSSGPATDSISESTTKGTETVSISESTTEGTETVTQADTYDSNPTTDYSNTSSAILNETSTNFDSNGENGLFQETLNNTDVYNGHGSVVEKAVGLFTGNLSAHDAQRNDSIQNSSENSNTKSTLETTQSATTKSQSETAAELSTATTTTTESTSTTTSGTATTTDSGRNKKSAASRGSVHVYISTED